MAVEISVGRKSHLIILRASEDPHAMHDKCVCTTALTTRLQTGSKSPGWARPFLLRAAQLLEHTGHLKHAQIVEALARNLQAYRP